MAIAPKMRGTSAQIEAWSAESSADARETGQGES
jgi:hypothetical protein